MSETPVSGAFAHRRVSLAQGGPEGCGTSIVTVGDAPPPVAASPPDSEAVRKTVTVLFCDLVGSTAFAESVDTESAHACPRSVRVVCRKAERNAH